jgi:hypothetical protein
MSSTTYGSSATFDLGAVINQTFGTIGRNFATFFGLSVVLAGLPAAALSWGQGKPGDPSGADYVLLLAILPVWLIAYFVLQAALVHGAVSDLGGRKVQFGDCLATGFKKILPLLGLAILMGLALMLGFMLFIIPCLIMMTVWYVAAPALVVERKGVFGAFSRSADLTRGRRWAVFGLIVIFGILGWLIGLIPGFIALALKMGGNDALRIVGAGIEALAQAGTAMIAAAATAVTYYELRRSKEGVGADALASVFD